VPSRIEDYALVGDCQAAGLVDRQGSMDWLCLPRFDSDACFAALLGRPEHGRWLVAPREEVRRTTRRYRDGSLVLDTTFETQAGTVTVTDCMLLGADTPTVVRVVSGVSGRVAMRTELVVRFDYGSIVPWVRKDGDRGVYAVAGPDAVYVQSDVPLRGENMTTVADFEVGPERSVSFVLRWQPSHLGAPSEVDAHEAVTACELAWRRWSAQCTYEGEWRDIVLRSLLTLKALTHAVTGAIAAAPTTSLPEAIGGVRNWDYRYCWVRDATFTLLAFAHTGFIEEARQWRQWLLRAVAGDPSKLQILYAIDGRRRIEEREISWLPGYENSSPVRIGNAAFRQRQLDVYGEVMDAFHQCHRWGIGIEPNAWDLRRKMLEVLEGCWDRPDEGIWEVRGPQRQFTHSKVMAWVAFDRGVRRVEAAGGGGPIERWRIVRDRLHDDVCRQGYDAEVGSFVQFYGSQDVDASLLMIPLVGFLPPSDRRVQGTVRAIENRLLDGGLVRRYAPLRSVDGLPEREGSFLPCSFWLADNWSLQGRHDEARAMFERLIGLCNDVGLLAEEYDVQSGRLVGNFPQAFSHVSLVNTALNLSPDHSSPARQRRG
jgi:GH15 family glucan-1,4-alpha-glucosidase